MRQTGGFLLGSMLCLLIAAGPACDSDSSTGPGDIGSSPPAGWPGISLRQVAGGIRQPTDVAHAGDGSGRIFLVEKAGIVRIMKDGTVLDRPFLDVTDRVGSAGGEQGLLGIAFPPGFSSKGHFYLDYTDAAGDTVVARYRLTQDPDLADPSSERIVLKVAQPFSNHNGGQIRFGPDGYLYIALGDGGSANDPFGNGQNPGTLLGKLLRIDVETGSPLTYTIPANNPFAGRAGARAEIWAMGLRNPWRFSFDRQTGDLYIADVGQNTFEEVDFQPAASAGGESYGWNVMEGAHCFLEPSCGTAGLVQPVAEYDHGAGDCSVTGGAVYRGAAFPAMRGVYLFADFCTGKIRGLRRAAAGWESVTLLDSPHSVSTFGEDEGGNLYLADFTGGGIYLIQAAGQ